MVNQTECIQILITINRLNDVRGVCRDRARLYIQRIGEQSELIRVEYYDKYRRQIKYQPWKIIINYGWQLLNIYYTMGYPNPKDESS